MRGELRRSLVFSILFSFYIAGVAPAVADDYWLQVTSQRSEAEALAAYKFLQSKFPNVLGNRQARIHRVDLAQGSFFRAMVGPFTSSQEAGVLCSNIMAAGGQCLVQVQAQQTQARAAAPNPDDPKYKRPPDNVTLENARKAVTAKLKDPESGRFADLARKTVPNARGEPTDVVCGMVNAKNSYGGYTGAKPFVYFVARKEADVAEGDSSRGEVGPLIAVNNFCGSGFRR